MSKASSIPYTDDKGPFTERCTVKISPLMRDRMDEFARSQTVPPGDSGIIRAALNKFLYDAEVERRER